MQDILRNHPPDTQNARAWAFALSLSAFVCIVMILGNDGEIDASIVLSVDPIFILALQAFVSALIFIAVPIVVIYAGLRLPLKAFFPKISLSMAGLVTIITISFMVVNSAIGVWNMSLDFGDSAFAEWARRSEDQLRIITEHITNFQSTTHFIVAFIVVAIIPAVGEELLFRGLIQNAFVKAIGNHHVAIWLTGFIFAAIHMQFFGLFPRMLLGVLFGYLYYWSGNLSVAMIGHFVNNGLAIVALYIAQQDIVTISTDQMEEAAPWPLVVLFVILLVFLIRAFQKKVRDA